MEEVRLDLFLKDKYKFSREYSKYIISKGYVKIDGKVILKPSFKVFGNQIELKQEAFPKYVSRAGLKLEKAVQSFGINLKGKICLDVGSSTGGFSDCMLQHQASKVYAVDVGTSQLHEKLLSVKNLISMENTDIREISEFPDKIDFISVDVSFISITKILTNLFTFLDELGNAVFLIKPQFEAGKENIDKNGIVKNKKIHKKILDNLFQSFNYIGFNILGLDFSPIKGSKGNIEYLVYLNKLQQINKNINISKVVEDAFLSLK